jgi:hypothetical protein
MSDYDNSNTIVLFKNEKYEAGGKHPVYKGTVTMDGKEKSVSVWLREASGEGKMSKGEKFLSGTLDVWEGSQQQDTQQQGSWGKPQVREEDIPF